MYMQRAYLGRWRLVGTWRFADVDGCSRLDMFIIDPRAVCPEALGIELEVLVVVDTGLAVLTNLFLPLLLRIAFLVRAPTVSDGPTGADSGRAATSLKRVLVPIRCG